MSKKYRTPFEDLGWSEMQKKYLDAFKIFKSSESVMNSSWVNEMDEWWKSANNKNSHRSSSIFDRVLEQANVYYFMSEQFSILLNEINHSNNDEQIQDIINKKFKEIESYLSSCDDSFDWSDFLASHEVPNDLMRSMFDNSIFNHIQLLNELNPDLERLVQEILSISGLGYSREAQEKLKEAIKSWRDFQSNFNEYQSVMMHLSKKGLELMRNHIISMQTGDESINSMLQIYNLWIESNEKVYGDYVCKDEYSELMGRLMNSMMAFKKKSDEIIEDTLSALHLPTTKAMNELEQRHYLLRKQVNEMRAEINNLKKNIKQDNSIVPVFKKGSKTNLRSEGKVNKKVTSKTSNIVERKQVNKKSVSNVKTIKKKKQVKKDD